MENKQLLKDLFNSNQHNRFIEEFERVSHNNTGDKFDDVLTRQAIISYYKNKNFGKALSYLDNLSFNTLSEDYLLCEIYADCQNRNYQFESAYNYFNIALKLNPKLKSARVKRLLIGQRLEYSLDEKELDWCVENAHQSKNISWLRFLAHISYSNRLFNKANFCFRSIVSLGSVLTYIDRISYTNFGNMNLKDCNSEVASTGSDDLYKTKINTIKDSEKLVVSLAPSSNFAFRGYNFDCNVLYVTDLTNSYYLFSAHELSNYIEVLITNYRYTEISLVGASKAGTGALIIYNILSKVLDIKINCVAFSPQITLFPFNSNLRIPSYEQLSAIYSFNPMARHIISSITQPKDIVVKEGDRVTVVYGKNYTMDKIETMSINSNSGVDILELDYSGHGSSIPLTIPEGKSKDDLKETYRNLHTIKDVDFQYLGGGRTIDIIDEIWSIYSDPKMRLNNFI